MRICFPLRSLSSAAVLAGALVFTVAPSPVDAQESYKVASKVGKFADVFDNLSEAILKRGFVIDYTGELNAMLERTAKDTGTVTASGKVTPFKNAKFVQFCPAKLTHEMVNTNPVGIVNCPIAISIYELAHEDGKINVGYRLPVASASRKATEINVKIRALLADIAKDATK